MFKLVGAFFKSKRCRVPVSNWNQEHQGSNRVEIAGIDDKWQTTVTLTILTIGVSGRLLPAQIIYKGKTSACIPKITFPSDRYVTYTANKWANEEDTVHLQCTPPLYIYI